MGLRDGSDPQPGDTADAVVAPGAVTALIARLAHAPTQDAPPLLVPGTRVGRYELIRALGRGGFGTVYEAHDTGLNRLVALKVLHRTEAADPAGAREAEVAARLAHPNIAALYDAGLLDGRFGYLVYEILHGETLEARLARGPIPPDEAVAIATQVARALAYAHAHGVVHRDLKPANVFLTAEGDVKVLDFGVALLFGDAAATGGTPAYMAPEQRRGEPEDARTDLFALGRLLSEMLGDDRTRTPSDLPAPLRRALSSLLAEDRAGRPRSAQAAIAALAGAPGAPRRRSRRRLAVAGLALVLLAALGGALVLRRAAPRSAAAVTPSIAVLPFADLSPQRDQGHLSNGVAEEILNALARVDGLRVAGRTSSFSFKDAEDAAAIAAKLHVTALLQGSVRRSGTRVRVAAQLVDPSSGFHLWSETYDRELVDVFAVEDEIARSVVAALSAKLLPSVAVAGVPRAASAAAYEQYLVGRDLRRKPTPVRWRLAVEAFDRSIALDPAYAPAWAELASASFWYANTRERLSEVDAWKRRAAEAAERAVALGPSLSDAYAVRGMLRAATRRWADAAADVDHAVALSPGSPDARFIRAFHVLLPRGRFDEALDDFRLTTELDPLWPLAWTGLGGALLAGGDTAAARAMFSRAQQLNFDSGIANNFVVSTLLLEGRAREALPLVEGVTVDDRKEDGPPTIYRLQSAALVHDALGDHALAAKFLAALIATGAEAGAFQIAEVYAARGDADRAFEWLDRAFAQRDAGVNDLRVSPFLRRLERDPRYAAALERVDRPE